MSNITEDDIETFDKVLDFCVEAESMSLNKVDAIYIASQTSNILRWLFGIDWHSPRRTIPYGAKLLVYDNAKQKPVVVVCYSNELPYNCEYIRVAQPEDEKVHPVEDNRVWPY